MKMCARCGKSLPDELSVSRSSACPFCRADLRTCTNCRFYAPGAQWDCRETIAEPVRDKEKANFCDFFRFREADAVSGGDTPVKKAKEDFFKLFGDE